VIVLMSRSVRLLRMSRQDRRIIYVGKLLRYRHCRKRQRLI
jgi:hypothetical protein